MPRLCKGSGAQICTFGQSGRPAQAMRDRCSWCNPAALPAVCSTPGGRARLRQLFNKLDPGQQERALGALPAEHRAEVCQLPQPTVLAEGAALGAPCPTWAAPAANSDLPDTALFIKEQWCDKILAHGKCWEIRSSATKKRGRVAIAQSSANVLVGEFVISDCIQVGQRTADGAWAPAGASPAALRNFFLNQDNLPKHCVFDPALLQNYKQAWAWVLTDVTQYVTPLPWRPARGAVVFATLAGRVDAVAPAAPAAASAPATPPAFAAAPPQLRVDLRRAADLNCAEELLQEHAAAVRPRLWQERVEGDGNCLYRAIARQSSWGEGRHFDLRLASCELAMAEWSNFPRDEAEASAEAWGQRMTKDGSYADEISCVALKETLQQPLIVWRRASPGQPPSCFVPSRFFELEPARPIYLLLDETSPGFEHYNALSPGPPRPVDQMTFPFDFEPLASPCCYRRLRGKQSPASLEGLSQDNSLAAQVCQLYCAGHGRQEICRQLKIAEQAFQKIAHENGLSRQKKVDLANFSRQTHQQISQATGVPRRTVSSQLAAQKRQQGGNARTAMEAWAVCHSQSFRVPAAPEKRIPTLPDPSQWPGFPHQEDGPPRKRPAADMKKKPAAAAPPALLDDRLWAQHCSWTFCPKCFRRRPDGKLGPTCGLLAKDVERACANGCDLAPDQLCVELSPDSVPAKWQRPYVTPSSSRLPSGLSGRYGRQGEHSWADMFASGHWPLQILQLTEEECHSLSILTLRVQHKEVRGGKAPTFNLKKTGVATAHWRRQDVETALSANAAAAFQWLMSYNNIYRRYIVQHRALLAARPRAGWFVVPTAQLLLHMPGVEVAARPWLYPLPELADTDLRARLCALGQITQSQKPSMKTSWTRKLLSPCFLRRRL